MTPRCNSILVVLTFVLLSLLVYPVVDSCKELRTSDFDDTMAGSRTAAQLFACDFEVFGRVQGVFFRKYTAQTANTLGVRGWCMNTRDDTVKGQLEAPLPQLNEMKHWLQTKGSPQSSITKAVFSPAKEIDDYTFSSFEIRR